MISATPDLPESDFPFNQTLAAMTGYSIKKIYASKTLASRTASRAEQAGVWRRHRRRQGHAVSLGRRSKGSSRTPGGQLSVIKLRLASAASAYAGKSGSSSDYAYEQKHVPVVASSHRTF